MNRENTRLFDVRLFLFSFVFWFHVSMRHFDKGLKWNFRKVTAPGKLNGRSRENGVAGRPGSQSLLFTYGVAETCLQDVHNKRFCF